MNNNHLKKIQNKPRKVNCHTYIDEENFQLMDHQS